MISQIRSALIGNSTLSPIIGTRCFFPSAISEPTQANITFRLTNRRINMADDQKEFSFFCFSLTISELETMTDAIISQFSSDSVSGTKVYKIVFLNQNYGEQRLDTGFFWAYLTFRLQGT